MTLVTRSFIVQLICALFYSGLGTTASAQTASTVNRGVVELEVPAADGIEIHTADDLARLVDDGATRRVIPVIGKGAAQTLLDLRYLRGIDMAIVPVDVIGYVKKHNLLPSNEVSPYYIAKLYNQELHLLARQEIKNVDELLNRKIGVGRPGSSAEITASRVFEQLQLPVNFSNDAQELALAKLQAGELDAIAIVGAKPIPVIQSIKDGSGLHLLEIPLKQELAGLYVPSRLTHSDYPALVPDERPVHTVAVGSVLAVSNLRSMPERNRNVTNFIDTFFTSYRSLVAEGHDTKWAEVNLAADVPDWQRYPAADEWLQRNMPVRKPVTMDELAALFSRFVDERTQATGAVSMNPEQKDALFQQFRAWQGTQPQ